MGTFLAVCKKGERRALYTCALLCSRRSVMLGARQAVAVLQAPMFVPVLLKAILHFCSYLSDKKEVFGLSRKKKQGWHDGRPRSMLVLFVLSILVFVWIASDVDHSVIAFLLSSELLSFLIGGPTSQAPINKRGQVVNVSLTGNFRSDFILWKVGHLGLVGLALRGVGKPSCQTFFFIFQCMAKAVCHNLPCFCKIGNESWGQVDPAIKIFLTSTHQLISCCFLLCTYPEVIYSLCLQTDRL